MNILRQIADGFSRWMDCVAATVVTMLDWLVAPRRVRLAEQENGTFTLQTPAGKSSPSFTPLKISNGVASCSGDAAAMLKGSRVELAMRSDQFFFRAIELPRRASEFLDGVVRAQIDRITPWDAGEAVFGWSQPTEIANDRISVTIAAAARAQIIPLAQAIGRSWREIDHCLDDVAECECRPSRDQGVRAIGGRHARSSSGASPAACRSCDHWQFLRDWRLPPTSSSATICKAARSMCRAVSPNVAESFARAATPSPIPRWPSWRAEKIRHRRTSSCSRRYRTFCRTILMSPNFASKATRCRSSASAMMLRR